MKLLLLLPVLLFAGLTFGQTPSSSKEQQPVEIHYRDYLYVLFEIKNVEHPSNELLDQIPFETYSLQRLQSVDVEIEDATTGYTIVLYSEEKCASLKH
jgi:hypothetical protein